MYIASTRKFAVNVYNRTENGNLAFIETISCKTGVDNIELDENADLWIGCHPSLLAYQSYSQGKKDKAPSEILKINYKNKGDYTVNSVFVDDGTNISGMATASVFKHFIFTGNVMDDHFLVLKHETN